MTEKARRSGDGQSGTLLDEGYEKSRTICKSQGSKPDFQGPLSHEIAEGKNWKWDLWGLLR